MKSYNIWSEGYRATGESSAAIRMGCGTGDTFKEACDKYFGKHDNYYDSKNLTYWGCRLFDNETEARTTFG